MIATNGTPNVDSNHNKMYSSTDRSGAFFISNDEDITEKLTELQFWFPSHSAGKQLCRQPPRRLHGFNSKIR